jgi:DNA polymerase-3 subunit alpha
VEDFLDKVKIKKPQMINLIKCGAFDGFGDRTEIMKQYVDLISDTKKDLNLRNVQMLLNHGLIPDKYDLQRRVFNFNKYLKNLTKEDVIYFDDIAYNFYSQNFDVDKLHHDGEVFTIKKSSWKTMYDKHMALLRDFIKANKKELLDKLNSMLTEEVWNKYCVGSISRWEMDSVSFYSHEHELKGLRSELYNVSDFKKLPEEPIVESTFPTKDGKKIPLFKICRIAGTVIDKNKNKNLVTLLTESGVVTVKIFGEVFNYYDKQLSEKGLDGKKHVIEKGFFTRGNKVVITGIRRGDSFIAKKYSRTPYHLVELITSFEDGFITLKGKRHGDEEE